MLPRIHRHVDRFPLRRGRRSSAGPGHPRTAVRTAMTSSAERETTTNARPSALPRARAGSGWDETTAAAWKPIGLALVAGAVAMAGLAAAARVFDEPIATFTRDVQDYAGVSWYVGAFSTVSLITWTAVATLGLVVAWLEPGERRRMGAFTVVVTVLLLDDAFLLHEAVGPENGVPQMAFVVVYAVAGLALLAMFLRAPRNGASIALLVGGALLALALLADQVLVANFVLEDGAKLLGALVWIAVPLTALTARPGRG